MEPTTAGQEIALKLFREDSPKQDFGFFFSEGGDGETTVTLPAGLATASDYAIRGNSATTPTLSASTPLFTIHGLNGLLWEQWERYP